jgi:hypothetical protein
MYAIGIAILVGEDSPPAPWLLLGFLLNWYVVLPEFSESRFNIIYLEYHASGFADVGFRFLI